MRFLFSFVGGSGHFEPLEPIARALLDRGHEVLFACAPERAAMVEASGFRSFPIGPASHAVAERVALRPLDREREARDLRERFVRVAARARVPLVTSLCEHWRPEVLVCDETDFGAMIAAEKLGIPHASVLVIAAGAFVLPEVIGDELDALRAEHGLPADPSLEAQRRYLVLAPLPPSFRDPTDPLPRTAHALQPAAFASAGPVRPPAERGARPTLYVTFGTVFNVESGDLLSRVVASLRELPAQLIVTVGPQIDPAELGPQPEHVRVERYIAQSLVLPGCDAMVSHGGSGSVLGALSHGLPSVLLPLGADQPGNAARCVALGVGELRSAAETTPAQLRAAVTQVLGDPRYRRNAERLRDEIAALPDAASAVPLLEALAPARP